MKSIALFFKVSFLSFLISCVLSCKEDEPLVEPTLSDKTFSVNENSPNATVVGLVADTGDNTNLEYSIVGGDPERVFSLDIVTGQLTVAKTQLLDFETNAVFDIAIRVVDKRSKLDGVGQALVNVKNVIEIPSLGLVAHYTFQNGQSFDVSGNGNNGTNTSVVSSVDRFGATGQALLFDSPNDFVKVTNPSFLNNAKGTFIAWVRFATVDHTQYIASVGDEGSIESYISFIRLDPARHVLGIYQRELGLANWVEGTTLIQSGKYYQVVMQSDGFSWSIYIDGVREELSVRGGSNTGKWISKLPGIDNFVIGSAIIQQPYTIPNFSGTIDEILLYDRALTECEIVSLYNDTK
jgi:Concanavalin A-like lectin/glucanases superfamily/Cadherin domain